MNGRRRCKQKLQLISAVVVALAFQSGSLMAAGYASGWDCKISNNGDWRCRTSQNDNYQQSLEQIAESREKISGTLAWLKANSADLSRQIAANLPLLPKTDAAPTVEPDSVVVAQGIIKRTAQQLAVSKPEVTIQNTSAPAKVDRLPVRPVSLTPRISYVRKESVITQDYQAPVMAPGLPVQVPTPGLVPNKTLSAMPRSMNRALSVASLKMSAPGSHTVQWYAAETLAEAQKFKAHNPRLKHTLIAQTRNQGRKWYLVLQGVYRDNRQAITALQQPDIARTANMLSPWVRPIASLRMLQSIEDSRRQVVQKPQVITLPPPSVQKEQRIAPPPRAQFRPVKPVVNAKPVVDTRVQADTRAQARLKPEDKATARLLQSPDNSFTIQWFADNKLVKVQQFKKIYPQLADARIVHFQRGGKDWYVLLSGVFDNNRQAVGFLKSKRWRDLARQLNPWTRSFKGLKKLAASEVASL
ncbi:hypothetical protein [Spongorhabdus nitratireducens]